MKSWLIVGLNLILPLFLSGQISTFSKTDSLHGYLFAERANYDVSFYDLEVRFDPEVRRLAGTSVIHFTPTQTLNRIQVDLHSNLRVAKILFDGKGLTYRRDRHALLIDFPRRLKEGRKYSLTIIYGGKPPASVNPPWDGGTSWQTDQSGNPWFYVHSQNKGAYTWWPCKDHFSDKADSARISLIVPEGMEAISSGSLVDKKLIPGRFQQYDWKIHYPIAPHEVGCFVGKYIRIEDELNVRSGNMDITYYVFPGMRNRAIEHFEQIRKIILTYERLIGPYSFPKDGFKVVQANYWGSAHHGLMAYGGDYRNNTFGFDYSLAHEAAYAWFGQSVSPSDPGDIWLAHSWATYLEGLYVEDAYDYETSLDWLATLTPRIKNQYPITGPKGVYYQQWKDSDRYYKGAWMLHSLRNLVNNDVRWFETLRDYYDKYRYRTLDTDTFISFFNQRLGKDYGSFFRQSLYHSDLPLLAYDIKESGKKSNLRYKWVVDEEGFFMPVNAVIGKLTLKVYPTREWESSDQKIVSPRKLQWDMSSALFQTKRDRF